jgi:hypothetical protein
VTILGAPVAYVEIVAKCKKISCPFQTIEFFFGQSYFESEVKWREYFFRQDVPPTVSEKVLAGETTIPFWYKSLYQLIQHQLKNKVPAEQLVGLKQVDLTIDKDHGVNFFYGIKSSATLF